jgi:signal transduction histidine kinase
MEMMDLRRIVHDVVDLYARPTCEKRGQTLHAHLEPVEIVGNPSRLSRVTRELLTNAMKFTPRGGHIEVTLHAADQAILCVSDNGWGFKEEELAHVFKQY